MNNTIQAPTLSSSSCKSCKKLQQTGNKSTQNPLNSLVSKAWGAARSRFDTLPDIFKDDGPKRKQNPNRFNKAAKRNLLKIATRVGFWRDNCQQEPRRIDRLARTVALLETALNGLDIESGQVLFSDNGELINPTNRGMSNSTGFCVRTVQRIWADLEENGLIVRFPTFKHVDGQAVQTGNRITLTQKFFQAIFFDKALANERRKIKRDKERAERLKFEEHQATIEAMKSNTWQSQQKQTGPGHKASNKEIALKAAAQLLGLKRQKPPS